MSDNLIPTIRTSRKPTLGDRIRGIANQLREESDVQIKATSRILGAAAQIAQNHDRLIGEVVEMVEEDFDQQAQVQSSEYTVEQLQQQFKTLRDAKAHFGIKAASWAALASKINKPTAKRSPQRSKTQATETQRLEAIEREIQTMRGDINQIMNLLNLIVEKSP